MAKVFTLHHGSGTTDSSACKLPNRVHKEKSRLLLDFLVSTVLILTWEWHGAVSYVHFLIIVNEKIGDIRPGQAEYTVKIHRVGVISPFFIVNVLKNRTFWSSAPSRPLS